MMKSKLLSGIDDLKVTNELKQRIFNAIKEDSIHTQKKFEKKRTSLIWAWGFALLVIFGISFVCLFSSPFRTNPKDFQSQANIIPLPTDKFEILENPPNSIYSSHFDYTPLAESAIFYFSDVITYAKVENLRWLRKRDTEGKYTLNTTLTPVTFEALTEWRTLATVRVIKAYKGSIEKGEALDILLPIAISDGLYVEDNQIIQNIKVGSEAFFFAQDNGIPKTYIDPDVTNLDIKDICRYSTRWGEEFVILKQGNKYIYSNTFSSLQSMHDNDDAILQNATFRQIEDMIKKYVTR